MAQIPSIDPVSGGDRPTWSVVIPVHNCAEYLARALPGVIAQLGGREDAEIIVVDDHSSDAPERVVEQMGAGLVRLVRNEVNLGAIATFNRCIELSRGELVHLLHGDDEILPGFYAAMESALAAPSVVAAVCRAEDISSDGTPMHTTRSYREGTGVWVDALADFAVSNRVRTPGIVVRRAAYEQVGGFRLTLPHAADWEMWTRLAAHGEVVFVDEVLARYRKHEGSHTSSLVRTGANVRERVTAIGIVSAHVPTERRASTVRRALGHSVYFAGRAAVDRARAGDWATAGRQAREALRCLALIPRGVPISPGADRAHTGHRAVTAASGAGSSTPRICVVLLTQCDRPAELTRAIASVRAQSGVDARVVLVVNGAAAPDPDPSDHLIVLPENVGIPAGRNIGVEACDTDVVMFLDDDAELQGTDHLAAVVERFAEDTRIGAMAMRLVDDEGVSQRRHVPRVGGGSAETSGPVTHFIGAAFAVRVSAFESIGGFDPTFFYAMEESDLAWRLLDRGWSIWYSADLVAYHPRTAPSRHGNHLRFQARNRFWMAWKSLPAPVFVGHMLTWTLVHAVRREALRDVLAGYREGWVARPERRPMRWRTVARMTRLGRPPVL